MGRAHLLQGMGEDLSLALKLGALEIVLQMVSRPHVHQLNVVKSNTQERFSYDIPIGSYKPPPPPVLASVLR